MLGAGESRHLHDAACRPVQHPERVTADRQVGEPGREPVRHEGETPAVRRPRGLQVREGVVGEAVERVGRQVVEVQVRQPADHRGEGDRSAVR